MATSKQEQLYNEIVEYYSYADRLILAVQDSSIDSAERQFAIIEDIVTKLEECADQLTTHYIDFIKNGESEQITNHSREALNKVAIKIAECRAKMLNLHKPSN